MEKFILGKKVEMSQIWKDETVVPVTVIHAETNSVSDIRTSEKNGYDAIQVQQGKIKREFRVTEKEQASFALGKTIDVGVFEEGERVRISGYSKGKGFQGVVKRHGFAGGPKTHGQKDRHRAPGSIGSTAAARVFKGKRMAGRMGNAFTTIDRVKIAEIRPRENIILLKGAIPGRRGSIIKISKI